MIPSFARFRLQLKVAERAHFPPDKSLLFRPTFLRDVQATACPECPPARAPLPFVLSPPPDDREWWFTAETWALYLTLIGDAARHIPCYIRALERFGTRRLGPDRARVRLEQVDMLDPRDHKYGSFYFTREKRVRSRVIPFEPAHLEQRASLLRGRRRITLHFLTPLRLWPGTSLVDALASRLGVAPAPGVAADESAFAWTPRPRRPSEGRGDLVLEGELDTLFPLLIAGQHLHIGAGAALGFGRYELRP